MPKRDYYNDPDAPEPNSIVPAVVAVVFDDQGRLLVIHRTDNDKWALPGGAQDFGESLAGTVRREVEEETGIVVEPVDIIGTYTDPGHIIAYDDGEVRQEFSISYLAKPIGGQPRTSSESSEVKWLTPAELDALDISDAMRLRINHALDPNRTGSYLG